MRRSVLVLLILFALAVGHAAAQGGDSYLTHTTTTGLPQSTIYEISETGGLLRTLTTLPAGFMLRAIVPAEDNRDYRAVGRFTVQADGTILGIDGTTGLVTSVIGTVPNCEPRDMVRTSDGDWLVVGPSTVRAQTEVFQIRGSTVSRLSSLVHFSPTLGITTDPTCTSLVVASHYGNPVRLGYFHLDPATFSVSTFALYGATQGARGMMYGARRPHLDCRSNDWIDTMYMTIPSAGTYLVRVSRQKKVSVISGRIIGIPIDMGDAGQRGAAPDLRVLVMRTVSPRQYDIVSGRRDGTVQVTGTFTSITPWYEASFLRTRSRHLSWTMVRPPSGRSLRLSFPGEGGRWYAVALSASGSHPGFYLRDGRVIPINPDMLTALCLSGGAPGLLAGTIGRLDSRGCAVVKVDANPAGSAVRGLVLHAAAVVLDPNVFCRVAWIVGPSRIELR